MPIASPVLLGLLVASAVVLLTTLALVLRQERRELEARPVRPALPEGA